MSTLRSMMMRARWPQVAASVGFACLMCSADQAVSAPERNPANGHFYEWIAVPAGITWSAAKAQAESSTLLAEPGYLVTFTSASEEAFVYTLPGTGTGWGGASDASVEGEWRWQGGPEAGTLFWTGGTSGTASGYENWGRDNSMTVYVEPNSVGDEDCLQLRPGTGFGFGWSDYPCASTETRYVVEYDSPCANDCEDGDPCTAGTCDPLNVEAEPDGCVYEPVSCPNTDLLPGRISIIKPGTLAKFVAKPLTGDTFALPTANPVSEGGSLRFFDTLTTAGDDLYGLPAGTSWKALGNPPGARGYKYKGAGTASDPCKVVLVKPTVVKGICKGAGVELTPPFSGEIGIVLSLGTTDRYCASFGGDEARNDANITRRKNSPAPGSCAAPAWETQLPSSGVVMSPLRDGTLLVTGYGGQGTKLDPVTGAVLGTIPVPDVRNAIWTTSGDPRDMIVGGYDGRHGYWSDGTLAWNFAPIGCCNLPRIPFGVDTVEGKGYFAANGGLNVYDLATGTQYGILTTIGTGWASVVDSTTLYVAWKALFNPAEGVARLIRTGPSTWSEDWNVSIDAATDKLPGPPAIAADGSVVVGTVGDHLGNFDSGYPFLSMSPGRLARVATDGTVLWNINPNTTTPPVISAAGLVYVGTQPPNQDPGGPNGLDLTGPSSIEAYDLSTGNLVWSASITGLPTDLLVGDDGRLYALTAGGVLAQFDQATGAPGALRTGLPGAGDLHAEAILEGGRIFVSGGGKVVAFSVPAQGYDAASPWPVRFHDNQHTADVRFQP